MYGYTYATLFSIKRGTQRDVSFELYIMFLESSVRNLWSSKVVTTKLFLK